MTLGAAAPVDAVVTQEAARAHVCGITNPDEPTPFRIAALLALEENVAGEDVLTKLRDDAK